MLEKRLVAMAGACLLAFAVVVCALAAVSTNPAYAAAAVQQSSTSVVLSEGRGNIYDCGFLPLTGTVSERYALIEPGRTSSVSYTHLDSACVLLASDISAQAADAAEVVSSVYEYIQGNVDYDFDKAQNIVDNNVIGYLPDPDETLSTKKGICYDYAALAAAMLRSQGIPTKLITGYVSSGGSELYHAWNMIWLEESGWITVEIRAPRHEWQRIDLTFAAAGQSALVGDGKGYADKEVY